MKYYFYHSYQSSMLGFQLLELNSEQKLEIVELATLDERIYKSFTQGGIQCLVMKSTMQQPTFLVRNVRVKDSDTNKLWYFNYAFVAETVSDITILKNIIRHYYLRYESFVHSLASFFRMGLNGNYSYQVDGEALCIYLQKLESEWMPLPSSNSVVMKFNQMMKELDKYISEDDIYFLVPEASVKYFQKQHPEFADCNIRYEISLEDYKKIIHFAPEKFVGKEEQGNKPNINVEEKKNDDSSNLLLVICVVTMLGVSLLWKVIRYILR